MLGTWEQLPRAVRDAGGLLPERVLCCPQGRSAEGEGAPGTGLGRVGWGSDLEAQGYLCESRLESGGRGAPAREVWVENHPARQCCVRAGGRPGRGGPKEAADRREGDFPGLGRQGREGGGELRPALGLPRVPCLCRAGVSAEKLQSGKVLPGTALAGLLVQDGVLTSQPGVQPGFGRGGPGRGSLGRPREERGVCREQQVSWCYLLLHRADTSYFSMIKVVCVPRKLELEREVGSGVPSPSAHLHSPRGASGTLKGNETGRQGDGEGDGESRGEGQGILRSLSGTRMARPTQGTWGRRGAGRVGPVCSPLCVWRWCVSEGRGVGELPKVGVQQAGLAPSPDASDRSPPPSDPTPGEPERRPAHVRVSALPHQRWRHQVACTPRLWGSLSLCGVVADPRLHR